MSGSAVGARQDEPAADRKIEFRQYKDEEDLLLLKGMIDKELVEPYSIFTFRMFVHPWPQLCHFCYVDGAPAGVVVCKIDDHKSRRRRGYLGMIVVEEPYRRLGLGRQLAQRAIEAMLAEGVEEVVLECETGNTAAQRLYASMGFLRDKLLRRYYFTGTSAFRLKLRVKEAPPAPADGADGSGSQE